MLSGGVDSTLCAWKALTESGDDVHIHHIRFINSDGRAGAEDIAVAKISRYLYLATRPFELTFSTIDMSGVLPFFGWDEDAVLFTAAQVAHNLRDDVMVYEGTTIEDNNCPKLQYRWERRGDMDSFLSACAWHCSHKVNLYRPLINMSKQEVWDELPEELKSIVWWCREPTKQLTPCGSCKSCKIMAKVLE
jgi:7-cyano-7-deazaguanine synthase in queuosine biosynthesis